MTDSNNRIYWDQKRWQKELRQEDRKEAAYFNELPRFIDLPFEERMAEKLLTPPQDKSPASSNPALKNWLAEHDEPEESEEAPLNAGRYNSIDILDFAAVRFNALTQEFFHSSPEALYLSCEFGHLLFLVSNTLEPDQQTPEALQESFGYDALKKINHLAGRLSTASASAPPEAALALQSIIAALSGIREELLFHLMPENEQA